MAFFENLGKKIGSVAETAADKANEFAEVTKLNNSISSEQKQIDGLFIEIGKLIFEREKDDPDSPIAELCRKILINQNNIAEFQSKIDQIKGSNGQNAGNAAQTGVNHCASCGAVMPENGKFCQSCGTPFNG